VRHLEDAEQQALLQRAAYTTVPVADGSSRPLIDLLIAIPNGAHLAGDEKQRGIQMRRLKAVGLKPGVADLLLALPRGSWHGLWVEMKKRREDFRGVAEIQSAVSDDQRRFGELMTLVGYRHAVCYGFDEAWPVITSYVEGRDMFLQGDDGSR